MKKIITAGFKPAENEAISGILIKNGFECEHVNENIENLLLKKTESCIVLMGIYKEEDLKILPRLTTNASNHNFIFGVAENSRSLSFTSSVYSDTPIFYLPPDEKELKKIVSLLKKKIENESSEKILFAGLKKLKINFEWIITNISISKTCKYLAELLKVAGYYNTPTEEAHAVLAIEEALVNSIEHGNLELDSSLKQNDVLLDDKYEELKAERLKNPKYNKKSIKITVNINPYNSSIIIADQGRGFDTVKSEIHNEEKNNLSVEQIMEHSGKGFSLIKNAFDDVQYNSKGTEIILINRRRD